MNQLNFNLILSMSMLFLVVGEAVAQNATQTPWEVFESEKVEAFSTSTLPGEKVEDALRKPFDAYFNNIPKEGNDGWEIAEPNAAGKVEYVFKKSVQCGKHVDFVYFQTNVNIPPNFTVNEFTVSYETANDAARIYFYNSEHDGVFDPNADLIRQVSDNQKVNLKNKVAPGDNRVVIVAYNQCAGGEVRGIQIKLNGNAVEEVEPNQVTDHCGNKYKTVDIGDQTWLSENLKGGDNCGCNSLKFTDGSVRGPKCPFYDGTPRYAYYNNRPEDNLGAIYNFAAIEACDVCPTGYRIPTQEDFRELVKSQGGGKTGGKKLLQGSSSGFGGGAIGRIDSYGSVVKGRFGEWWTIDEDAKKPQNAFAFVLAGDGSNNISSEDNRLGCYVRCIKIKHEAEPLTPVTLVADKFKINAFSVHEGQGIGEWFVGYNNNDKQTGRIVKASDRGATILSIEKVSVTDMGPYTYAFKVQGTDDYLVVDKNAGEKVFIKSYPGAATPPSEALFRNRAAFTKAAGSDQFSSFESMAKPDHFLRHQSYVLYVHKENTSELYKQDASWKIEEVD